MLLCTLKGIVMQHQRITEVDKANGIKIISKKKKWRAGLFLIYINPIQNKAHVAESCKTMYSICHRKNKKVWIYSIRQAHSLESKTVNYTAKNRSH